MPTTRFLLIRHAMTEANGRRIAGRLPGLGLDAHGQRQAQALAERLVGIPLAAIYSSPLQRAIETATPMASLRGLGIATREEFQELDFGEWSGRSLADLAPMPAFHRFNSLRSRTPVPRGETMLEAQARMVRGLETLRAAHPDESVAVIGHGDPIRSVVAYHAGIAIDLFHRIEISPASISVIDLGDDFVRIVAVNETVEGSAAGAVF